MLHGALAYLECRLHTAQDAGDHTIFIAEVEDVVVREGEPLLFFRGKYRQIGAQANAARQSDKPDASGTRRTICDSEFIARCRRRRASRITT